MDREQAMKRAVLVVEDDPATGMVFQAVLEQAGLAVDLATHCRDAVALAAREAHALWLVDAHLPDGDAVTVLPRLRSAGAAAMPGTLDTPAIAHTASRSAALHDTLRAAGYADVLVKPCTADALLACVARRLRPHVREPRLPWDDGAAARALGDMAAIPGLRARFLRELPVEIARVRASAQTGDAQCLQATLHRLTAACAFVGAARLADAVRRLREAPGDADALATLLAAAAGLD